MSNTNENASNASAPVKITVYRWAGQWGPFKVKIPCGECALTTDVLKDTFENELAGVPVELDVREWLTEWYRPITKGGWHAPIVMVDGKVVSQGEALNRGVLTQAVTDVHAKRAPLSGNHLFGKDNCPHCRRAKAYLDEAGIEYVYHDVVAKPRALYEMLARVKPIVGPKTPITVPQIWIDGDYVGGADQLGQKLGVLGSAKADLDTEQPAPTMTAQLA
ncbi:MAG: glutaredoxin [Alphaproteobacteria bacterium]|nr:glutaredoxin [Alphaproteobacteria bacterium]